MQTNYDFHFPKQTLYEKNTFTLCVYFFYISLIAQVKRYPETIFASSTVTPDVVYDTAPLLNSPYYNENSNTTEDLIMDVYQPTGDTP